MLYCGAIQEGMCGMYGRHVLFVVAMALLLCARYCSTTLS
jgi:hypothetical protein